MSVSVDDGKMISAIELLEELIADLEGKLNLAPGEDPIIDVKETEGKPTPRENSRKQKSENKQNHKSAKDDNSNKKAPAATIADPNLPDICKLEFKVGLITKVWIHPDAEKLYCEEIDCGEAGGPRQIASGLRKHYEEGEMLGKRVLVVANLKAKNLVGFKSHGMVLCAAQINEDGTETVEFIEPPDGAPLGEVVTFEDLPSPSPMSASQVEKYKIFAACMDGMTTNDDCVGTWNGHAFMTSAGPCRSRTVKGGAMR
ncbi:hypothetical protein ACHAXA_004100 [Cyclostephanos tholiformis]|uniref:tRNA-binding domain-containing protein n=1 Tax=Cyclostephanos tholiformis TaxID=382380 RepID=A0ABD3SHR7_9STRA